MTKPPPTRADIIKAWKKLDAKNPKPVGVSGVARKMGISKHWFRKLFAGESLTEMKRREHIRLSSQEQSRSTDDLLKALDKMVTKYQRLPPWIVLTQETGVSEKTFKTKLGGRAGCSKKDVCRAYEAWLRAQKPASPNLEIVTRELQGQPKPEEAPPVDVAPVSKADQATTYQKTEGLVYGPALHFGNLAHAPKNEQGVVFLFGMVSQVLGFESVEYIGPDFPDCEAKRRVKGGGSQKVEIEFEYKSRDFLNHGHDPQRCDVIVCWKDNWKERPASLEVIALKDEIEKHRDKFKP